MTLLQFNSHRMKLQHTYLPEEFWWTDRTYWSQESEGNDDQDRTQSIVTHPQMRPQFQLNRFPLAVQKDLNSSSDSSSAIESWQPSFVADLRCLRGCQSKGRPPSLHSVVSLAEPDMLQRVHRRWPHVQTVARGQSTVAEACTQCTLSNCLSLDLVLSHHALRLCWNWMLL